MATRRNALSTTWNTMGNIAQTANLASAVAVAYGEAAAVDALANLAAKTAAKAADDPTYAAAVAAAKEQLNRYL